MLKWSLSNRIKLVLKWSLRIEVCRNHFLVIFVSIISTKPHIIQNTFETIKIVSLKFYFKFCVVYLTYSMSVSSYVVEVDHKNIYRFVTFVQIIIYFSFHYNIHVIVYHLLYWLDNTFYFFGDIVCDYINTCKYKYCLLK